MTTALEFDLTVQRGGFRLEAALSLDAGGVLALLGPNGSGKTTLLSAIAGIVEPTRGTVRVGSRTLTGAGPGRRAVPASGRRMSLLGQDPQLFPHLDALDNVAFGPRAAGLSRRDARARAVRLLDEVGLGGLEGRRPAALSGGQQQRVAIARALAAEPDVLLLDEPMAALDVEHASAVRTLLRDRLRTAGLTTVLVTHDVLDAVVLADRVAILDHGRIVDDGPAGSVLGRPRTPFIAALAGLNLVRGTMGADGVVTAPDGRRLHGHGAVGAGHDASVVFRPSLVRVASPGAPGENTWTTTVTALEPSRGGVSVRTADGTTVDAPASVLAEHALAPGDAVTLHVHPGDVLAYAAAPDFAS